MTPLDIIKHARERGHKVAKAAGLIKPPILVVLDARDPAVTHWAAYLGRVRLCADWAITPPVRRKKARRGSQ